MKIIQMIGLVGLLGSGAAAAGGKVSGSLTAKCQEAIGTGGFYVYSHCEPIDGESCRCFSKPKEGKGEPSFATIVYADSPGAQEAPEEVTSKPPANTNATDTPLPKEREKGKRFRIGEENSQAEGVEGFDKASKKERKNLRNNEDWAEGKLPKQNKIFSKDKSLRRKPTDDSN